MRHEYDVLIESFTLPTEDLLHDHIDGGAVFNDQGILLHAVLDEEIVFLLLLIGLPLFFLNMPPLITLGFTSDSAIEGVSSRAMMPMGWPISFTTAIKSLEVSRESSLIFAMVASWGRLSARTVISFRSVG